MLLLFSGVIFMKRFDYNSRMEKCHDDLCAQSLFSASLCCAVAMAKRVAVILSGCGVYDGTEIHEASAVLVHLSREGASVSEGYCDDSRARVRVCQNN